MRRLGMMEVEVPESVGIVTKIPKLSRTPRPKKDKQAMVPMHVSPRNPLRTKLIMEEGRLSIWMLIRRKNLRKSW